MTDSIKIMADEIIAQSKVFELYGPEVFRQAEEILLRIGDLSKINRIYITGCGDSFFAGLACRDFFLKYTNIHTEVHQAIEFSRYVCPQEVDDKAIVLSISSSGRVARTVECALRAKEKQAISIGVTRDPKSLLARSSDENLIVNIPDVIGVAPGTQSYIASLLAIISFAIALGKQLGILNEEGVKQIFDYITEISNAMKMTVEANFDLINKYIMAYTDEENPNRIKIFHILGSGPNFGTAQFGSMKLLEASGLDSIPQGIEEWAHSQYFTTKPGTHVIVLAPQGNSRDRALEILQAVTVMDGKKIVIGEENDEELQRAADIFLPIIGIENIKEEFSQLIYPIPLEIIALHMTNSLNGSPFEFDKKPWRKAENFRQIFSSQIKSIK